MDLLDDGEHDIRISVQLTIRDTVKRLEKKTHLNHDECIPLLEVHAQISTVYPLKMNFFRQIFSSVFSIRNNFMLSRLHNAFDKDGNGLVDESEWLLSLSIFMRGGFDEQIEFCYTVYDVNGDGALERDELMFFLQNCLVEGKILKSEKVLDGTKEIIDIRMKKLDMNGDGSIFTPNYELFTPAYDDGWIHKKKYYKKFPNQTQTVRRMIPNTPQIKIKEFPPSGPPSKFLIQESKTKFLK